jgi:hypothetical protein
MKRIAVLMLLVVGGCSGAAAPSADKTPAPATTAATAAPAITMFPLVTPVPTLAPTPQPAGPKTFPVGYMVTLKVDDQDWAHVTVTQPSVHAYYKGSSGFKDTPDTQGYVYIQALVTYEALANGVDYNPFDWDVYCDGMAMKNYAVVIYGPKPELSSGTLSTGRKAQGWVVYEVPAKGEVRMSYSPGYSDSGPVFEVVIRPA